MLFQDVYKRQGCGKSTTLYSFIKEMNNESVNVITVEDPVEYTISGVNQVQVNNKANLTFASALRSILRQDPNIVMVGEIRDEETAEICLLYTSSIIIVPKSYFSFPVKLFEMMNTYQVNTIYWVPSAYQIISQMHLLDYCLPQYLKLAMFAGCLLYTS